MDLDQRVAVITGGASGIGLAFAHAFGAAGMKLMLADIERPALDEAMKGLRDKGYEVHGEIVDVASAAAVEAFAVSSYERFGNVHVLCNNAGVVTRGAAWEHTLEDWNWVLGVDLWGVIYGVKSFVPRMIASGEPGHIVNTASIAGLLAFPMIASYDVAKAGVVAMSEGMSQDLARLAPQIGISVLCPGVVTSRIAESERNRPGGGAPTFSSESQQSPEALPASVVADMVVDAVRTNRFWILPHPKYAPAIVERAQSVLTDARPQMPRLG